MGKIPLSGVEKPPVLMLDRPDNPVYDFLKGKILNPLGLTLDEITATNAVKCTFPNNRVPNEIATEKAKDFEGQSEREGVRVKTLFLRPFFENCKRYLADEIQHLRPRVLLSMGEPCHQLLVTSFGWPVGLKIKDVFGNQIAIGAPFHLVYVPGIHQPSWRKEYYKKNWPRLIDSLRSALT